jgi:hypothetical protein
MLVRFEPSSSRTKAKYVNPKLVRALTFNDTSNYTVVEFDGQHNISIDLPIEQVAAALSIPDDDEAVTLLD